MSDLTRIVDWLTAADSVAAFTGAGISTESGIPDFRSPGGVWARSQPVQFQDFLSSPKARHEYWRQKAESHAGFRDAQPNAAHRALARWEAIGRLAGVITQNIDGLHQRAGNRTVWELHGSALEVACLNCDYRGDSDPWVKKFQAENQVPDCPRCGGLLKHATVSFGQELPEATLEASMELARSCDLFFALGSSLVVYPAAGLPELAQRSGAKLVIINRDATPLDSLADVVIHAPLGETLLQLDERWQRSL